MEIMKIRVQWLGVEKEKCFKVVGDVVKATFWDEDKFLVPLATKKGFIKYCQDKEITSANELVVSNYIKQQLVRLWNGHMRRSIFLMQMYGIRSCSRSCKRGNKLKGIG